MLRAGIMFVILVVAALLAGSLALVIGSTERSIICVAHPASYCDS